MRIIFFSILFLIISCSKSDINSPNKEYNKIETTLESQAKSNYNGFAFYEGQALSLIHI